MIIQRKPWKQSKDAVPPANLFAVATPFSTPRTPFRDILKRFKGRATRVSSKPRPPRLSTDILPPELWLKILRYTLRLTGAQTVDLKDPFQSDYLEEDYPDIHPGYFEDRRACRRVCRTFNSLVTETMMEYIVLHTQAELEWIVTLLERDHFTAEHKRLGEWTTRIDFCINGSYDPSWMLRLLVLTPNLLIYTTNTGHAEHSEHSTDQVILNGLVDYHARTLKRLEWAGLNDAPTFEDLLLISRKVTSLTTLHLRCLYKMPDATISQPMLVFPSLKSLSFGLIPLDPPPGVPENERCTHWDIFLEYLVGHPIQLSRLERLDIDICPVSTFFAMYGHKIRTFRTMSWSTPDCLQPAFELLPNLQTFLYVYHTTPNCYIPLYHPTLQRIGVTPLIENYIDVPQPVYQHCIIKPLDNLLGNVEDMDAKQLRNVRICDRGAYTGVFENDIHLFWHWHKRLQAHNVQLQNKYGDLDLKFAKYGDTPPPRQPGCAPLTERVVRRAYVQEGDEQPSGSTSVSGSTNP